MIKNKSKLITLLAICILLAKFAQAQQSVNSTGGNATGSGGTVSYSIGQVIYSTNTGINGNVAQGVQQAYEIFPVEVKQTVMNISLVAFPNPTPNNLTLQISDYNNEKLSYQLLDMQGKQLNNAQITSQQTEINMNGLPTATYFIHVVNQENKKVQSFKISKN